MYYKNLDLSSDIIDTLIFGGGGTKGFVYLGLIKYLEEHKYTETIKYYYGVSAGSIICLLMNLGYNYKELVDILLNEVKYEDLVKIDSKSILNIFDKFSIADSTYLDNTLKALIERKGFNPYINFKQLYDITKKEFNVGFVKCFQNEFILANYKTRPDMPVWLAVRASSGIPLVFQPVIDAINGFDFLIDGAIINDNVIGYYLNERYVYSTSDMTSLKYIDKYTQTSNNTENTKLLFESITELNKVKLQEYLMSVTRKVFFNQDSNKSIYSPYIFNIDCRNYNIGMANAKLSRNKYLEIINDTYNTTKSYFETELII
jgi:patatin-like phospholipase/acyl hydrolase